AAVRRHAPRSPRLQLGSRGETRSPRKEVLLDRRPRADASGPSRIRLQCRAGSAHDLRDPLAPRSDERCGYRGVVGLAPQRLSTRLSVRGLVAALLFSVAAACHPRASTPPTKFQLPEGQRPPGVVHTVKPGETLWRISRTYGVDERELAEIND